MQGGHFGDITLHRVTNSAESQSSGLRSTSSAIYEVPTRMCVAKPCGEIAETQCARPRAKSRMHILRMPVLYYAQVALLDCVNPDPLCGEETFTAWKWTSKKQKQRFARIGKCFVYTMNMHSFNNILVLSLEFSKTSISLEFFD